MEVEAEAFGPLRDIILAAVHYVGGGLETVSKKLACVTDLRLELPVPLAPWPDINFLVKMACSRAREGSPVPRPTCANQGQPERFLAEIKSAELDQPGNPGQILSRGWTGGLASCQWSRGSCRRKVVEVEQLVVGGGLEDLLGIFGDCIMDIFLYFYHLLLLSFLNFVCTLPFLFLLPRAALEV